MNVDNLVDDYLQLAKARSVPSRSAIFHLWTSESQLWDSITQIKCEGPCPILIYPNWQKIYKRNLNRNLWSHFCFVSATKPGSCLYTDGWTKLVTQVVSWSRSTSWTQTASIRKLLMRWCKMIFLHSYLGGVLKFFDIWLGLAASSNVKEFQYSSSVTVQEYPRLIRH